MDRREAQVSMGTLSATLDADDLEPLYLNDAEQAAALLATPGTAAFHELVALTRRRFEEDGIDPGEAESFVADLRREPAPAPEAQGVEPEPPPASDAQEATKAPSQALQANPLESPPAALDARQPGAGGASVPESLPDPSESLPEADRIRTVLAEGPLPGREVARRAGLRWSTAYRRLAELQASGLVIRTGRARRSRFALGIPRETG